MRDNLFVEVVSEKNRIEEYFHAKREEMLKAAPAGSFSCGCLEPEGEYFKATFRIHSRVGQFVAELYGKDPRNLIDQLTSSIFDQLSCWKRSRFDDQAKDDIWHPEKCWSEETKHNVVCSKCDSDHCPLRGKEFDQNLMEEL
ncbi:MAG: hypothetical protein HN509_15070 [Halobacteriovoraceae bacterium]|jgi:hypothetical protein|nr:hypothetical protein [Halobacteriovoraceae bacterium]MBT5095616.1 hypothetical protein [Halobacteriovoraceae bacterium]